MNNIGHHCIIICFSILIWTSHIWALDGLTLTTYMGVSKSIDNHFSASLEDLPNQVFVAEWDNKSLTDSHWWAGRLEYWKNNKLIGFEVIHHKIYLKNTNDIIEHFSISDGYNQFYLNIGQKNGNHVSRLGAGIIIAHPDVTIAGRERYLTKGFKGFKLAGATVQANYEYWLWENNTHFITIDNKFTVSYCITPISNNPNEFAVIPDIAFQFSLGFGSKQSALEKPFPENLLFFAPGLYPRFTGEYILGTGMFPNNYEL